eukprot:TRINITY_DN15647_c0_g2_i2.p1 TRINITY_DN15647_c0_g2~~TRINITY_DN15647_c0_g2_i2.p1  ORF type:complete len:439 (-),score=39.36 TRINITY_DN15647_c0_g2_i2:286-1602(-)
MTSEQFVRTHIAMRDQAEIHSITKGPACSHLRDPQESYPDAVLFQPDIRPLITVTVVRISGRNMTIDQLDPRCVMATLVRRVSRVAKIRASNVTLLDSDGCILTKDVFGKRLCDVSVREGSVLTLVIGTAVPDLDQLRSLRMLNLRGFMSGVRAVKPIAGHPCQTMFTLKKIPGEASEPIHAAIPCLEILRTVNSRFVHSLIDTYQTRHNFYVLLEYVPGVDLAWATQQLPWPLSHEHSAFYIGSALLAVDALGKRNIMHTGITMTNIVLDVHGYPKLTGFDLAFQISRDRQCTSWQYMKGVTHYMAPEIFGRKRITAACNLWSLGVLAYELLCGDVPFGSHSNNPNEIIPAIMSQTVVFPSTNQNLNGQALVRGLLQRKVRSRFSPGMVKADQFFQVRDVNFLKLLAEGALPAPVKPQHQPEHSPQELSDADENVLG